MEFNHISDCWQYVREATSREDLEERLWNLPRWSGDWSVEPTEDNQCLVINDYYDKRTETYDQDSEVIEVPYDKEDEENDC